MLKIAEIRRGPAESKPKEVLELWRKRVTPRELSWERNRDAASLHPANAPELTTAEPRIKIRAAHEKYLVFCVSKIPFWLIFGNTFDQQIPSVQLFMRKPKTI